MPKAKWATLAENAYGKPQHYFASSCTRWRVSTDLDKLITQFKADGYSFNVYRVELPENAAYSIQNFMPVVEDDLLHWVGFWENQK